METDLLNRPADGKSPSSALTRDRHSVDASSVASECHPNLVNSRMILSGLIDSERNSSIPMLIDSYMARAMRERSRGNRPLSPSTVNRYVDELKRNEWKLNGETIKFTRSGVLADGHHRLEAIILSDIPAYVDVRFSLDEDIADTIDIGKKRTNADRLSMKGVPNSALVSAASSLLWRYDQTTRMTSARPSPKQLEEAIEKHPLVHDVVRDAARVSKHLRLQRMASLTPSICAFVWTLAAEFDKAKAYEFFDQVDRCLNISDERHPAKMLRRYLLANEGPRKVGPTIIAAVTVKAWNIAATGGIIKDASYLRMREAGDSPEKFPIAVRFKKR